MPISREPVSREIGSLARSVVPLFAALILAAPAIGQTRPGAAQVTTEDYRRQAQAELARLKAGRPIDGPARNVIIFIGDGMARQPEGPPLAQSGHGADQGGRAAPLIHTEGALA